MRKLAIAYLLIMAGVAYATNIDMLTMGNITIPDNVTVNAALVYSNEGHELFRLEPGGCLRGSLKFFKTDGSEVFSLADGVWYPAGCNK